MQATFCSLQNKLTYFAVVFLAMNQKSHVMLLPKIAQYLL